VCQVAEIQALAKPVSGISDLLSIATIASGSEDMGAIIAKVTATTTPRHFTVSCLLDLVFVVLSECS
jgi:hypothetical protein